MFTEGYASAGMFASADVMQICFTEIASAYLNAPRTFVEDRPRADSDEPVTFEEAEVFGDSKVLRYYPGDEDCELRRDLDRIVASGSVAQDEYLDPDLIGSEKSDSELAILRCYHFEECASPEACYKALIPLSKLKGLVDQNDIPDVTDFRCDVCASCPTCMRSAQERTKSLQEAFEQSIILKSVHLEPENQRVAVELPFVKEPVEFLTKKHGRNSNYYQALRVYKSQCRKSDEVKAKLRNSMQDLISRGFMVKLSDMDKSKQEVVAKAGFQNYFPWRAVYKEGSVSSPVWIVVDPSASGLNQTLAKGENMLTKIPEVLIAFGTHKHAWCSDISKMYNMLKLSDQALPYSLFLYSDSLSDDAQPDVY